MNKKLLKLSEKLRDERSRKVLFVSHCFLNENTRYFGGAFCRGMHPDIVKEISKADFGIVQMPCPEQLVWGGVLKKLIWLPMGTKGTPAYYIYKTLVYPLFIIYTHARYSLLASKIVSMIKDYVNSGFTVIGVAGIDGSPSCGVNASTNLRKSFSYVAGLSLDGLKRENFNAIMFGECLQQAKGIFFQKLSKKLKKNKLEIKLTALNFIDEMNGGKISLGLDAP